MRFFGYFFAAVSIFAAQAPQTGWADDSNRYRIGSEWGKSPVAVDTLPDQSAAFQRAAKATAYYRGATAFYLGKIGGKHLIGTNSHVQSTILCNGRSAEFTMLGKSYRCANVIGTWTEIDFALVEIQVPLGDEALLAPIGRGFAFDAPIYTGQLLITLGHGAGFNPRRKLTGNQDSDCKVFSGTNDFRLLPDPDTLNPGTYKAWSFANGCDVSHGDSGSAFVDRQTGEVVGLVWTGRIPKDPRVADSQYLDQIIKDQSPEVWSELTLTVPAAKIREFLKAQLDAGAIGESVRELVREFIGS